LLSQSSFLSRRSGANIETVAAFDLPRFRQVDNRSAYIYIYIRYETKSLGLQITAARARALLNYTRKFAAAFRALAERITADSAPAGPAVGRCSGSNGAGSSDDDRCCQLPAPCTALSPLPRPPPGGLSLAGAAVIVPPRQQFIAARDARFIADIRPPSSLLLPSSADRPTARANSRPGIRIRLLDFPSAPILLLLGIFSSASDRSGNLLRAPSNPRAERSAGVRPTPLPPPPPGR